VPVARSSTGLRTDRDGPADEGGGPPRSDLTRPQLPPLALTGSVVVAAVSALTYLAATYRYRRDWWRFLDLSIYRDGAETVLRGDPLYGGVQFLHNSWTNTPFTAVLYVPILAIHGAPMRVLALVGNMALLVSVVALTLLGLRVRVDRRFVAWLVLLAAVCLWIEPVLSTIRLGQVNLLLAVLVLADVVLLGGPLLESPPVGGRPGRVRWHGVGIGLAAGIKLTPALFVAYLLLRRRYRAAAVAAGTALATVAIGFAAAPSSSTVYWLHGTVFDSGRVGSLDSAVAQSLHSSVARELGSGPRIDAAWLVADVVTAVVGLLLAAAVARAGHEMLAVTTVGLLACLVSPFSWSHHWVWFVPLLVVTSVAAGRRGSLTAWLPVVALGGLLAGWITGYGYPPLSDHGPHLGLIWQVDQPALRPVTTNLYPLLAYVLLAVLLVLVGRASRRRRGTRADRTAGAR
jgi:alpha-1,2-mannosyltransferase